MRTNSQRSDPEFSGESGDDQDKYMTVAAFAKRKGVPEAQVRRHGFLVYDPTPRSVEMKVIQDIEKNDERFPKFVVEKGNAEKIVKTDSYECELEFEDDVDMAMNVFVPETVSKHPGFFSALATIGVSAVGSFVVPKFEPHQRRFHFLQDVDYCCYQNRFIRGFKVPPLGCEILRKDMYENLSFAVEHDVVGNTVDVCYGVREKIDGVEIVCFGLVFDNEVKYFIWDTDGIYAVDTNEPFQAERLGQDIIILSRVSSEFYLRSTLGEDMDYKLHDWMPFDSNCADLVQEGLVFNINFREFKVSKIPTYTLKVIKGVASDSTNKYKLNIESTIDGCYDFAFEEDISESIDRTKLVSVANGVYRIKRRLDKIYPDSHQYMQVSRAKALKFDDIYKFHTGFVGSNEPVPVMELNFRVSGSEIGMVEDDTILGSRVIQVQQVGSVCVAGMKCVHDGCFMVDQKIMGRDFGSVVQERSYFSNVYSINIVAMMVKRKMRERQYISWGDCFHIFRRLTLINVCQSGYTIRFSNSFDQYSFYRFLVYHLLYLKDGMAYDLLKVSKTMGPTDNKILVFAKKKPKGDYKVFKRYYVYFRDKEDLIVCDDVATTQGDGKLLTFEVK